MPVDYMKFPHTHFKRGKQLRIKLRDGKVLVARFKERLSKVMVVEDAAGVVLRIPIVMLRHVGFYNAGLAASQKPDAAGDAPR